MVYGLMISHFGHMKPVKGRTRTRKIHRIHSNNECITNLLNLYFLALKWLLASAPAVKVKLSGSKADKYSL